MDRRKRNRILLWIIFVGLANLTAYTVIYWYLGGDARNGEVRDGSYYVRGHFIHTPEGILSHEVARATWIYSYIHSISIWATHAAVLVSMFILARPHIIATMPESGLIRGNTVVTICITIIVFITATTTMYFVLDFLRALHAISTTGSYGV